MIKKITVEEDLKARHIAINSLPFTNKERIIKKWDALARNVLKDDLGEFTNSDPTCYFYDDATRDRLIAHTRQDAAMVYGAVKDTHDNANMANKYAQCAAVFSFVAMCVSLYSVFFAN